MKSRVTSLSAHSLAALVAISGTLLPATFASGQDSRIVVKTADDLPRHTYKASGSALELIKDDAKFFALVDAALADALADLKKYKIDDVTTLKGYYDAISSAYVVKGDLLTALEYSDKAKALETKDQEKLMRGVALRARLVGEQAAGKGKFEDAKFKEVFRAELKKSVSALPLEPIKDRLIGIRNQAKIITRELIEAGTASGLDPLIEAGKGELSAEIVGSLANTRNTLDFVIHVLPIMAEVYGEVLDSSAKTVSSADLWTPRLVTLESSASATPVVIGVWDSGVDTSLYTANLWSNAGEKANGKDDDNNGFVDDLHGIAFGQDHKPTTGPLASLAGLKGDKDQLIGFIAASQDMQAGINNPGVEAFQNFYKNIKQEQMRDFGDDMNLLGSYAHGTHVAGIAIAGNPFARLVHVTENWPYKSIPDVAPTIEEGKQWGESNKQAVAYLAKANARVVNMSWRVGRSAFESMLEAKGVGATPQERAELSRKIFAGLHDGLEAAIKSAPDILFIAGSGNEDNDVDFAEYVPAGLRLPNLLTVGAIDDKDKFTDFTTTGKNVELYANGYRIESNIPGGQKIKFSGTSMAAPQVANLAAKILALKPELKPAQVIEIIRKNADPVPGQPGRFIINPKKTIASISK
jgi:subtilisin family serine protease